MSCQTFTAAAFSCGLFVDLSAFGFVFSRWKACSNWLRRWRNVHFFPFKNSWVSFALCFGSLFICLTSFAATDWMWAESIDLYASDMPINKHSWAHSLGSHTPPYHNTASAMFDHQLFLSFSRLQFILVSSICIWLILNVPKRLFSPLQILLSP